MEFVKQNENYSIYWADIYTDGQVGAQNILCKFTAILVNICSLSRILKLYFTGFLTNFFLENLNFNFSKDIFVLGIFYLGLENMNDWLQKIPNEKQWCCRVEKCLKMYNNSISSAILQREITQRNLLQTNWPQSVTDFPELCNGH